MLSFIMAAAISSTDVPKQLPVTPLTTVSELRNQLLSDKDSPCKVTEANGYSVTTKDGVLTITKLPNDLNKAIGQKASFAVNVNCK